MSINDIQANGVRIANPTEVDKIRFPEHTISQGYLNDPIQFVINPDIAGTPIVQQFFNLQPVIDRDYASFLMVDGNADPAQFYPINTYTPLWRRDLYVNVFDDERRAFTSVGNG